jgi:hypothetical protein
MVAINGRQVIRRAVSILCNHYNRCVTALFYGEPTASVHPNPSELVRRSAPLPPKKPRAQAVPNGRIAIGRKQGRIKRRQYNDLARENSTLFIPGGPPKKAKKETKPQGDCEPTDCDLDLGDETQSNQEAFIKKEYESLLLQKSKRESQFKAMVESERKKGKTAEKKASLKEAKEAERLRKMKELERKEERERTDRWKDQRLAQLEKEKQAAKNELAREKLERKHSKLQRVFKEQQQRHRVEECWEQLREEAKLAAERERSLMHEKVILQDDLRATGNAFQRACNEREHVWQEKEEERIRRLRAEESLHQWKELMKEYFPEGQPEQQQQQQEQQQGQLTSFEAQFELYEKKWEVLRSGIDIDGTEIHLILFSQIPWPVVNMTPTDPSQILPEHIQEFFMHPLREKPDASGNGRNRRLMVKEELIRWHSDKFDRVVLSKVQEEHKQAASEVAGMITRVLTDMLS